MQFGQDFEKIFFKLSLTKIKYLEAIKSGFYTSEEIDQLSRLAYKFYERFKETPSRDQMKLLVQNSKAKGKISNELVELIYDANLNEYDEEWLTSTAESWIKWRNFDISLIDTVEYIKSTDVTPDNVDSIVNKVKGLINDRNNLTFNSDLGLDFFDPNAADRDGYNALQRKNAAQDKASVAVTRAGAKLDKWTGLDGTGRGVGGMAKKVWNKLTGKGPKKPVSPDYTSQPGNKNFQVGQQVQWKASANNKGIKQDQIVTSKIVGLEGQTYTDKTGQQQTVAKGNALFLTKNGALHFQKPISLLTAV